jgi:spore coat polysaccharide biosynthesis protein SpsF
MCIPESDSSSAYKHLFESAERYICLCEYYSPRYKEIPYRHKRALFRADHAGTMMETFPQQLVDYGFLYRKDPVMPIGDITWFLLEKIVG